MRVLTTAFISSTFSIVTRGPRRTSDCWVTSGCRSSTGSPISEAESVDDPGAVTVDEAGAVTVDEAGAVTVSSGS